MDSGFDGAPNSWLFWINLAKGSQTMGGFGSGLASAFGVALGGASVPGVEAAVGAALVLLALQAINEMSQKKRTGPSKVANSLTWFSEAVYFGLQLKMDEKWALRLNAGLVDFSGPIRLDKVCPSGVVRITQQTSFVNGLVASLTLNMYTPQTFSVFCANKQAFQIHLDDRGQIASFQRLD